MSSRTLPTIRNCSRCRARLCIRMRSKNRRRCRSNNVSKSACQCRHSSAVCTGRLEVFLKETNELFSHFTLTWTTHSAVLVGANVAVVLCWTVRVLLAAEEVAAVALVRKCAPCTWVRLCSAFSIVYVSSTNSYPARTSFRTCCDRGSCSRCLLCRDRRTKSTKKSMNASASLHLLTISPRRIVIPTLQLHFATAGRAMHAASVIRLHRTAIIAVGLERIASQTEVAKKEQCKRYQSTVLTRDCNWSGRRADTLVGQFPACRVRVRRCTDSPKLEKSNLAVFSAFRNVAS